ncbi:MAG TPA: glycosyltransferase family A protein [Daejeonella sp.]|nr:glycosyltransferase family A protein [Daejeonella sp.]
MDVTVLMSVYNSEKYLKEAIRSILNQTYRDFEFIIIDDGSSDNSRDIIEQFAAEDPRIVFVKNHQNMGLGASLNRGIKLASGKYIARQDADDLSAPNRLSVQLKHALENQEVDIIGSDCYEIDIYDNIIFENRHHSAQNDFMGNLLSRKGIFAHGSAFLKKDKLLEVGLYDSRFYFTQDIELWLRLISNGAKVHIMNQLLYSYRRAPSFNPKRNPAKDSYNKVLHMMYVQKESAKVIDLELQHIQQYLSGLNGHQQPYAMANYWKSLGNVTYMQNCPKRKTYQYIYKAFREKNPLMNYPKFLLLGLVYLLPPGLVRSFMIH